MRVSEPSYFSKQTSRSFIYNLLIHLHLKLWSFSINRCPKTKNHHRHYHQHHIHQNPFLNFVKDLRKFPTVTEFDFQFSFTQLFCCFLLTISGYRRNIFCDWDLPSIVSSTWLVFITTFASIVRLLTAIHLGWVAFLQVGRIRADVTSWVVSAPLSNRVQFLFFLPTSKHYVHSPLFIHPFDCLYDFEHE